MATDWIHICPECGERIWESLFDSLIAVASTKLPVCDKCSKSMPLHLSFSWKLSTGSFGCIARAAFVPDQSVHWRDKGRKVEFHPFLVIVEGKDGQYVWLPYWHRVGGKPKYGQWAPCMDISIFESLIEKAKSKGYVLKKAI
jgi:hypothetical protein